MFFQIPVFHEDHFTPLRHHQFDEVIHGIVDNAGCIRLFLHIEQVAVVVQVGRLVEILLNLKKDKLNFKFRFSAIN